LTRRTYTAIPPSSVDDSVSRIRVSTVERRYKCPSHRPFPNHSPTLRSSGGETLALSG
jgi:hypothetical protein